MKYAALVILGLFASSPATSQDNFIYSGAGTISCGKFLSHQDSDITKKIHMAWLQGFLTGMNMVNESLGTRHHYLPDSQTIDLYISNFCKSNPLGTPMDGAVRLYRDLTIRGQDYPRDP